MNSPKWWSVSLDGFWCGLTGDQHTMDYLAYFMLVAFVLSHCATTNAQNDVSSFEHMIHNPELYRKYYWSSLMGNTPQLIQLRGFQSENHTVVTPDGYLLQVFRIVNPGRNNGTRRGYPIVAFQGLWMASEAFQDNTDGFFWPDSGVYTEWENNFTRSHSFRCPPLTEPTAAGRSLVYTLATCGFDLWFANVRDSSDYASHVKLNPQKDSTYWDITLDSYTIDARAILDYAMRESDSSSVGAVCHSIGCLSVFQLLAEQPQYNQIVKPFLNLAPFVFTTTTGSIPLSSSALIEPILKNLLLPTPNINSLRPYIADLVRHNPLVKAVYFMMFGLIGNINPAEQDWTRVYRIPAHFPSTLAARVFAHVGQRRVTPELYKFDFGPVENQRRYGSLVPPVYHLDRVTNPYVVLFRGVNDWLADYEDLQRLKRTMAAPLLAEFVTSYSHSDFMLGRHCNVTVNLPILRILHQLGLNYN